MLKKSVFVLFALVVLAKGAAFAAAIPFDSVGLEKRNGKTFLVHKVAPKETLFALSRKYSVPVAQIVDANPKIQSGINVGQMVYIPRKAAGATATPAPVKTTTAQATTPATAAPVVNTTAVTPVPRTFVVDAKGNKMHQVAEKQTLFSIARMYQVAVADIKKWNKMTSDIVNVGDNLIVGVGNKTTSTPQYVPEVDDDVEKTKASPVKTTATRKTEGAPVASRTESASIAKTPVPAAKTEIEVTDTKESESISKVTEAGMAEVMENRADNNKYLALHNAAPIGTILQVKNAANNQTVYVRVVGKLPAAGTDKAIIKISKRAFQKLAPQDDRFRVEVSYMP